MAKKKHFHELTPKEIKEIRELVIKCGDRNRVARLLNVSIKAVDMAMGHTFQGVE